jgi:hypothetical protein
MVINKIARRFHNHTVQSPMLEPIRQIFGINRAAPTGNYSPATRIFASVAAKTVPRW